MRARRARAAARWPPRRWLREPSPLLDAREVVARAGHLEHQAVRAVRGLDDASQPSEDVVELPVHPPLRLRAGARRRLHALGGALQGEALPEQLRLGELRGDEAVAGVAP